MTKRKAPKALHGLARKAGGKLRVGSGAYAAKLMQEYAVQAKRDAAAQAEGARDAWDNWQPPNTMRVHVVSTGQTIAFTIPPSQLAQRKAMDKRRIRRRRR